ncbi:TIGR02594 family protein [Sphingomonas sp. BK235]|uniref:TIGR02594 family protein n=1 Tax=Sphingomonas sp. BK235 TaxID=2512131 RepID=UPI0010E0EF57|nr:TIGR02594 family protein [Sphingomonas sp. BK235]TCP36558.1 uncharacterized protein (TIGR02594 family) [Sphingomonas sp. BK235]
MADEPAWLAAARAKLGTREAPGPANSPTIMGWAKRVGNKALGMVYNADSVPWCGLFVATCMHEAGIKPAPIAVRAKAWATWGLALSIDELAPGAVLVFERPGGGHVGFYDGETATAYRVLGGNQGDAVSCAWIAKERCVARRWPSDQPLVGSRVRLASTGAKLSSNEA